MGDITRRHTGIGIEKKYDAEFRNVDRSKNYTNSQGFQHLSNQKQRQKPTISIPYKERQRLKRP